MILQLFVTVAAARTNLILVCSQCIQIRQEQTQTMTRTAMAHIAAWLSSLSWGTATPVTFGKSGTVERISLGSLRQSLRITVALSLILVLFSVGYGVPISQYVSIYSLIYYEQRSLRDRSTTR